MPRIQARFECKRCGRCCTKLDSVLGLAAPEEWERIIEHLVEENGGRWRIRCRCKRGCNHSWEGQVRSLEELPRFFLDGVRPCPFLRRERDSRGRFTGRTFCQVYRVRPSVCALFPFNRENALTYNCPGYSTSYPCALLVE